MGIVGTPFEGWVEKQIEERQKIFGSSTKTPEQVLYMNNRGAWLRVASSVDLSEEKAQELGIDSLAGSKLAKSFVLFGGITNTDGSLNLSQGGIVPDLDTRNNIIEASKYSYGLGSSEYGYTPPPGVESLKVVHKNRGAIRQYDIKIRAANRDQFNIIDALYLRLGYYILAEWGHTSYFDTSGADPEYIANPEFFTPAFNSLFGGGDSDDILSKLKTYRETTTGNYDGGLVKVTNFSWNLNDDGSYDIGITGVSTGGLIDSLTLNFNGPNVTDYSTEELDLNASDFPEGVALDGKNKTTTNNFILLNALKVKEQEWNQLDGVDAYKKYNSSVAINFKEENKPEQYYITLKNLFEHFNEVALKLNHSNTASDQDIKNSKPLVRISTEDLMFTHFFQNSADPYVCLIPFTAEPPSSDVSINSLEPILGNKFRTDNPYAGSTSEIHVNIDFIALTLKESVDQDSGDMNLVLFLDKLMKGISEALGNINNFLISYDEVDNLITIVDDTVIPGENDSGPTELRVFGVTPGEQGSFVRKVGIQSKISNKISTQLSIGSTATNTSLSESSGLLGKWNLGLIDRVQRKQDESLVEKDNPSTPTPSVPETVATPYEEYWEYITKILGSFRLPSINDIAKAKQNLKSILKEDIAIKTANGNVPSKGFIPVDLSVEIDGLSGVLQYQKFTITPNILPPSYDRGVDFIIQGIDHTIAGNEWTTSYNTLSVARPPSLPPLDNENKKFSILKTNQ